MKAYDKKLMERRDGIAEYLRSLGMYCLSQLDMTKASNGAQLFLECWTGRGSNGKVILMAVDKFGGICCYHPCTEQNSMEAEKQAIAEYFNTTTEHFDVPI